MGKLTLLIVVVVAAVAFMTIGPRDGVGSTPPDFQLYTTRGKLVSLSEYHGQVVVLDFWASWCPPCRAAIPAMQRLHEAYKDKGVVVLGINVRDNQDASEFMERMNATYRVLVSGENVASEYGVTGIPTLIVVGADGTVKFRETGWSPAFESKIAQVVEKELERTNQ